MENKLPFPNFGRISWIIAKRIVGSAIFKYIFYIDISLIILCAIIPVASLGSLLEDQGVIIVQRPLEVSILIAGMVISIYLALYSLVTVSQERDDETVDVLFYGPINPQEYLMGHFLGQWILGIILISIFGCYLLIISLITGLVPTWNLVLSLGAAWFSMTAIISSGILIAVLVRSTKKAIFLFISLIILLVGIQIGFSYYQASIGQELVITKFLAMTIHALNKIAQWLSPYTYFLESINEIRRGEYLNVLIVQLKTILFTFILLNLSIFTMKRRGLHP